MTRQTLVEMEGPGVANLYRIFEEKNSDLLLKIFGSKSVSESCETTDQAADNSREKLCLIPESWKEVAISDVLDWETRKVNVESLKRGNSLTGNSDVSPCLGFIRFRYYSTDLTR